MVSAGQPRWRTVLRWCCPGRRSRSGARGAGHGRPGGSWPGRWPAVSAVGRGSALGVDVLAHGRQRRGDAPADRVVVEADDRDVVGHLQPGVLDRADDAAGDGVGEAQDGGRPVVELRAASARPRSRSRRDCRAAGARRWALMPAASSASNQPSRRCRSVLALVAARAGRPGPRTRRRSRWSRCATRRWPRSTRCWAAARAPSRSSMLMLVMPGAGAWSTNTNGQPSPHQPADRRRLRVAGVHDRAVDGHVSGRHDVALGAADSSVSASPVGAELVG